MVLAELSSQDASALPLHHLRALLMLSCVGAQSELAAAEWRGKATFEQQLVWGSCSLLLRTCSLSRARGSSGNEATPNNADWPTRDADIVARVATVHTSVLPAVVTRLAAVCRGATAPRGGGAGGQHASGDEAAFGAGHLPVDCAAALEVLLANRSVRGIMALGGDAMRALRAALVTLQADAVDAADACSHGKVGGGGGGVGASGGDVSSSPSRGLPGAVHGKIAARVLNNLQRECDVLAAVVGVLAKTE